MAELRVENLTHKYSAGTPFEKTAIENVSLTIPSGQLVGLLGHTGSGKSTFIQHLNALLEPTDGKIYLDGCDINESKKTKRDVRFKVGLVFQYPEYQLFEETVYADIAFGPKNMGLGSDEIDACVREAAEFAGVGEDLFDKSPLELSGGQKRRIAIAGVIAMRPEILILDEPTAGLDPRACGALLSNLVEYKKKSGSTVIMVTHNIDSIAEIAERLLVFSQGHLSLDGTPEEVFSDRERIESLSLTLPKAAEIAGMIGIEKPVYTHAQLIEELRRMKSC